jgi:hypothetical protein
MYEINPRNDVDICHCTGPQNGEPLCSSEMKYVSVIDGRWIYQKDLGPVPILSDNDYLVKRGWKDHESK